VDEGSQEISIEQWIAKGEVVERTGLDERTIERKVKDCVRIRPNRKQRPVVASLPVLAMLRPWRSAAFVYERCGGAAGAQAICPPSGMTAGAESSGLHHARGKSVAPTRPL
jgi:hypothetical protein